MEFLYLWWLWAAFNGGWKVSEGAKHFHNEVLIRGIFNCDSGDFAFAKGKISTGRTAPKGGRKIGKILSSKIWT
ncbi:MAG: hypothetical protein R3Y19_07010, partial [Rikenellaceae bacterium]